MKEILGVSNKLLEIDLSSKSWKTLPINITDRKKFLGGKGLGLKIYYDRLKDQLNDVEPLGEKNILCFMAGVMTGTGGICSARFAGITKSPLTKIMVTASCGGPFGIALKTAGYDSLIIKGKSASPVYLQIADEKVDFLDAANLWGGLIDKTQEALEISKKDGELVIGPAGENEVLYANIASGHRFLGRGGMGAVMGSKLLKAVVVRGRSYKVKPVKPEMFKKTKKRAAKYIARNSYSKAYKQFGTNANVLPGMEAGYAPVNNFCERTDPRIKNLSGQIMAQKYQTKSSSCTPCSIQCGHKGTYPDNQVKQIPEYETIGLWGSNIGNYDPDIIGTWNVLMNQLGMDTISTGGTVAWAMEAGRKGLRKTELDFEKTDNIEKIISDIAYKRDEGAELCQGSARLSQKYGGSDFAIHVKGLEMAAYDPRAAWGQGLNYAVANRGGCHLSAYTVSLEILFGFLDPYTTQSKAFWVDFFEDLNAAINSLQTCQFTSFAYLLEPAIAKNTPKFSLGLTMQYFPEIAAMFFDYSVYSSTYESITGIPMTMKNFRKAGRRTHILERYMNTRMGITAKDDTLPDRFLNEAETNHPVKKVVNLEPMIRSYYKRKGYDSNGIPTPATLKNLEII